MSTPSTAYRGDDPFVFVCYSHEDRDLVYPEITWLQQHGVKVWYDEGISAGRVWRQEIHDALTSASRVLFYVSRASAQSSHCNREINVALDEDKEILPVYLEDVELPGDLVIGLSRVQALFRQHDADYRQRLLQSLGGRVDRQAASRDSKPPADRTAPPRYAVHPIRVRGVGSDLEFLAESLSEHVVLGLNRTMLKAHAADPALPSDYAVSGSLRARSDGRVRLLINEFDAGDHREVWSKQFDFASLEALEDRQDQLVALIAMQSWHHLMLFLRETTRSKPLEELDIWETLARAHFDWIHDLESRNRIVATVKSAVELDPDSPFALCQYAFMLAWVAIQGFTTDFKADRAEALRCADRALNLAPNVPWVMDNVAYVHWAVGNLDYAIQLSSRVAEIVGNGSFTLYLSLLRAGRVEEAVSQMDRDMISIYGSRSMADAYAVVGRLDDAFRAAYAFQAFAPGAFLPWMVLANLHGLRGELELGRKAWEQAKALRADLTVETQAAGLYHFYRHHPEIAAKLTEGLRSLGVD